MLFQEERHLSFDRSQEGSFTRIQHVQELYEERIASLTKQLGVFFREIGHDEIFKAMQENSLSQEYALQRASELFNDIMKSEQETTIHKLQNELVEYKTLNLKLEYDKKQITANLKELEDRVRRMEIEKCKFLNDYDTIAAKLSHVEGQFNDTLKKKEFDLSFKMENNLKKLENALTETEAKYFTAKKELENLNNLKKNNETMSNEIEVLRKELKNHEKFNYRQIEEIKLGYEVKIENLTNQINESEKNNESIKLQFKNYQKQSEELAGNQQTVIKNLVEKSKQLKQKIISQKSKLAEFLKFSKDTSQELEISKENHEKKIGELEEKIKIIEKEAVFKENEILNKHQLQITQLQMQYQHMMDSKLAEMQKEVDLQIERSQEHDKEVKYLMDLKMKEIEKDYISVTSHERLLTEKENFITRKFNQKIDEIQKNSENTKDELKKEIIELQTKNEELEDIIENHQKSEENLKREMNKEREKFANDLNIKSLKLKEMENTKFEMLKENEKTKMVLEKIKEDLEEESLERLKANREISELNSNISELKSTINSLKQNLHVTKSQHEQILSEKIDKSQFFYQKEKSEQLEQELENKNVKISKLEKEISNLNENIAESKLKRSEDFSMLELEQSKHFETKNKFKELEGYSQQLLNEVEIRDSKINELKAIIEQYKHDLQRSQNANEQKVKEFLVFQQESNKRENELRNRFRVTVEKTKKTIKNSIFYIKNQILSITELFEHEYSSMNKHFSAVLQEISIKIIEMQLKFRKELDIKSENYTFDIKSYYRSKFLQLEEYISDENIHWSDPDSEGIRRAVKSILEKKYIAQIEIKSLRESLGSLTEQNENLYRENQKLQIRLHANNEAFDQLQKEVADEANKIKSRLENTGNKGIDFSARANYFRG